MNAPVSTTRMFDMAVMPVLHSEAFAELCRNLTPDKDIIDAVTARAIELRGALEPSVTAAAWCHALALDVVRERANAKPRMSAAAKREFEATVLPLSNNLYGAAMRLTRDPSEAEDLVQDSMVRAFRFWHTFQLGTNIKAWMFTILRNTFINGYHRRGRAQDFQNDVNSEVRSHGSIAAVAHSDSRPPGPEEAVAAEVQRIRVHEALASLPTDYRLAVTYCDFDGLSYREIADVMECPIGTVMSRIYRARKILHDLLHDHAVEVGMATDDDVNERSMRGVPQQDVTAKPRRLRRVPVSGQCELFAEAVAS
jgi:RNA polymerase sigma-70 factor (ECF subfamily)